MDTVIFTLDIYFPSQASRDAIKKSSPINSSPKALTDIFQSLLLKADHHISLQ
jgi:hypothetical protein